MTDYELYKLLDSNGYETTNENLDILKEGLKKGIMKIKDAIIMTDWGPLLDLLEDNEFNNFVYESFNEEIEAENLVLTEGTSNKFIEKQYDKIYYTIKYHFEQSHTTWVPGVVSITKYRNADLKRIIDRAESDPKLNSIIQEINSYRNEELTPTIKKEIKLLVKHAMQYLKQVKYYKPWLKQKLKQEKRDAKYAWKED